MMSRLAYISSLCSIDESEEEEEEVGLNEVEKVEEQEDDEFYEVYYTPVPPNVLATPVPLSVSGGTASFFNVPYIGPAYGPLKEKYGKAWVGKDVERALDELPFYEDLSLMKDLSMKEVLQRWTMSYAGVYVGPVFADTECTTPEEKEKYLLLLYNVRAEKTTTRFLDIKIGEETAVAHWKGKSGFAAWRNSLIDRCTNSKTEGFRLEGFDGPPSSLSTRDAGEEFRLSSKKSKKLRRFHYQRFTAADFLIYVADVNDLQDSYIRPSLLSPAEFSEAIIFDVTCQLAQLCSDFMRLPVAQMWIGSSLCLAYDSGQLPERQQALSYLNGQGGDKLAEVMVFDWGRSQLDTRETWKIMAERDRVRNKKYWESWLRGVLHIFFDSAMLFVSQFCQAESSSRSIVLIEVFDYDTFKHHDYLGKATMPLAATNGITELDFKDSRGQAAGSVQVSITPVPVPSGSRLLQSWVIEVVKVSGIPKSDIWSESDPMLRVSMSSPDSSDVLARSISKLDVGAGTYEFLLRSAIAWTPVKYDDADAEFNYKMWFGMASPAVQQEFFARISRAFGTTLRLEHFQLSEDEDPASAYSQLFKEFVTRLPQAKMFSPGLGLL